MTTCFRLWHRGLSLWQPAVPPVDAGSSHWQLLSVLMPISHNYTCWVFDQYTRIDILAHWPLDQMAGIVNKFLHSAGCSLESISKHVCVILDVDLALFRRQATAGTSDAIDHRRIHASLEQNFILPHFMTIERYLYVFVFFINSVLLTLFLLMILYVYLFFVLRIASLFVSFLLSTLSSSVCFMFYVSLSYLCTCCVFIHLCIESRGLATFWR